MSRALNPSSGSGPAKAECLFGRRRWICDTAVMQRAEIFAERIGDDPDVADSEAGVIEFALIGALLDGVSDCFPDVDIFPGFERPDRRFARIGEHDDGGLAGLGARTGVLKVRFINKR